LSANVSILGKHKHPLYDTYLGVYTTMSVYLQNEIPTHIFEQRRPIESKKDSTLKHRQDNYRNFLKDKFDLTINKIIESALGIDVDVYCNSEEFKKYLSTFTITKNGITQDIKEYLVNNVFRYSENDPNSLLVVLPKHPTEYIYPMGVITKESGQIPNFDNIKNKRIEMELELVSFKRILFVDENRLIYTKGIWELEQGAQPYYIEITKEATFIHVPSYKEGNVIYTSYLYYANGLSEVPFIATKNNHVTKEINDIQYTYNVAHLFGAAQLGDMIYGNQSDLTITIIRNSHPIKTQVKTNCPNVIGYEMRNGIHCNVDTHETCGTCKGAGYTLDESPYGTIFIDQKSGTEDKIAFSPSVAFTSPDMTPMTFNKEYIKELKDELDNLLGITLQNNTNASEESKAMDMQQRISRITIIVKDIFRVYQSTLRVMENYYTTQPPTLELRYDDTFDVQNSEDLQMSYGIAKQQGLPVELLKPMYKRLYLKKNGNNLVNELVIEILLEYDVLACLSLDEQQKTIAIYGSMIDQKSLNVHLKGEQILKDIIGQFINQDRPLLKEEIEKQFLEEIDKMNPNVLIG